MTNDQSNSSDAITEPAPDLLVEVANGTATLWLNRPQKRNAVTVAMWAGIAEICERLATDADVRVLVVRGVGDHFCAGADIGGFSDPDGSSESRGPGRNYGNANEAAEEALAAFPKPTIAFIAGSCVGGGCQIAIACDIRIADTTSRFGITPARLGIMYPQYSVARAVALIGASATKHFLYSAEIVDADRALRIGLIDELHDPDAALERLDAFVETLTTKRSLFTQMGSKAMVDEAAANGAISKATQRHWADLGAKSPDAAEGIAAFLEKRDPQFGWTPDG